MLFSMVIGVFLDCISKTQSCIVRGCVTELEDGIWIPIVVLIRIVTVPSAIISVIVDLARCSWVGGNHDLVHRSFAFGKQGGQPIIAVALQVRYESIFGTRQNKGVVHQLKRGMVLGRWEDLSVTPAVIHNRRRCSLDVGE
ncbi:MAG: hypothetical protein DCF28_09560 [Alphaproteobacteria bacterium]|nr:MAG: hypothetical protein DCF28_09560 [Alphaproteobacteria bacterium]PZO39533.1 MAG: hypothetical protein DCE92_04130 [Alphaproteobacteria bacterium]